MSSSFVLIISGAFILAASLIPMSRLIVALPSGGLKNCWYALASLVVAFIAGYVTIAFSQPELLIAWIFFLGSMFVFMVGISSQRIALYAKRIVILEHENVTDPLMRIYNRRYLDARLRKQLQRSQKDGRPLSVLLIDVDHFKRINDDYGHLTGDAVLRQLGPLLVQSVRQSDTVARYGGEEIMILAPATSSRVASALAERIRAAVSANTFYPATLDEGGVTKIKITASIGVSTVQHGDDIMSLLRRADEALYRGKNAGRNCVVVDRRRGVVPMVAAALG